MVSQVVAVVPVVIVKEPAESVEAAVTAAAGLPVPQLVGVPMVGAVVCRDLTWALLNTIDAKVVVVPLKVITEPEVSMTSKLTVPAAFCTWKAAVESVPGLTITPVLLEPDGDKVRLPVPP